ncbi:SLAP domain-containing protein [Companilactobacillus kimchiensis]|uniref:S-layer protein C-terminal domain-containing protein n=1 Tax=Companilactobacillus kimchiensis TaxID=993692 RepID=A0A0R2LBB0_9LACO|nr:SLAP domain-containing protein [Companilactobacillus kimchiensis]KRN99096.1 hypothetical protein IV57_GL000521 [Companilactobacillus kimchiensis]
MKLIQKSLLFASLLAVGTGVTSIPTIIGSGVTVQAATTKGKLSKIKSTKIKIKVAKAQVYTETGKKTSKCVTKGKTCKTTEKNKLKGCTYYKVGKDEFVKSSDVTKG